MLRSRHLWGTLKILEVFRSCSSSGVLRMIQPEKICSWFVSGYVTCRIPWYSAENAGENQGTLAEPAESPTNLSPRKELVGLLVPWHRPSLQRNRPVIVPKIPAGPPEAWGEHLLGGHAEGEVPRHSPSSGLPFAAWPPREEDPAGALAIWAD